MNRKKTCQIQQETHLTYWLPEPLPIPKNDHLFFNQQVIDIGVSWWISRRVQWAKMKKENLAELTNTIDDETFNILCALSRPYYLQGISYRSRTEKEMYDHLKYRDIGDFRILDLRSLKAGSFAFSPREERSKPYLIFWKSPKGWKLYPRTLLSDNWGTTLSNVLRTNSVTSRAKSWEKIFKNLPDFAWSEEQKYAGKLPYRCGTAPKLSNRYHEKKWWDYDSLPYWKNLKRAYLAIAALERVSFPEPVDNLIFSFHWSLKINGPEDTDHNWVANSFHAGVRFDGWTLDLEDSKAQPTHEQNQGLSRTQNILNFVARDMKPENALLLDCIYPETSSSLLSQPPCKHEVRSQNYHLPWMDKDYVKDILRTKTAHDGAYHLSKLPPEWVQSITKWREACDI